VLWGTTRRRANRIAAPFTIVQCTPPPLRRMSTPQIFLCLPVYVVKTILSWSLCSSSSSCSGIYYTSHYTGLQGQPQGAQLCPLFLPSCIIAVLENNRGERSANKFRKSQIRKFADLTIFIDLRIFSKCFSLRICDLRNTFFLRFADLQFANPIIFTDLKLPQINKYIIFQDLFEIQLNDIS
jgi:hypothetical protein